MTVLNEIRAALAAATPGPWGYNSYSRVEADDYVQRDEEAWLQAPEFCDFPRRHMCASCVGMKCQAPIDLYETDATVCSVPAAYGDTATGRHEADANLIAHAPGWLSALLDVAEAAQKWTDLDADPPWDDTYLKAEANHDLRAALARLDSLEQRSAP